MIEQQPVKARPGSPETRRALVDAARTLFMQRGYEATSVRAIAGAAGVDAAMVNHCFGGKEALFQAVMELPVDLGATAAAMLDGVGVQDLPPRISETFVSVWENPDTGPVMIALLRRVLADPTQLAMLRSYMFGAVLGPVARLLAQEDPVAAPLRVALLASHLMGTMTTRHILQIEPLASLPASELAVVLENGITNALRATVPTGHGSASGAVHPHQPDERQDDEQREGARA